MEIYPSNFPKPIRDPHTFTIDMGIIRADADNGNPVQSRAFKNFPQHFRLEFAVKITNYKTWVNWVNQFGYRWFILKTMTYDRLSEWAPCSDAYMRFTSDLNVTALTFEVLRVTVEAESYPQYFPPEYG